ncbi:hypothetical protein [Caloramator sp. Dgby_cultured_2]|nr:hypothetical protein [Caloramator sp. Dgby_cultured_2]WDU84338.1 hypothetical protein PWK10_08715 [Caloramator sp. Dgby_cultured_2]
MERTIEEGLEFCKVLAEAGVDAFDVDKGCYDNWFSLIRQHTLMICLM